MHVVYSDLNSRPFYHFTLETMTCWKESPETFGCNWFWLSPLTKSLNSFFHHFYFVLKLILIMTFFWSYLWFYISSLKLLFIFFSFHLLGQCFLLLRNDSLAASLKRYEYPFFMCSNCNFILNLDILYYIMLLVIGIHHH